MNISKADQEVLDNALEKNEIKPVLDKLESYKFKTRITKSYAYMKVLEDKPEWVEKVRPSKEDLDKYRSLSEESHLENKRTNLTITEEMIKEIIRDKNKDFAGKLIYLLLITGRRQSELLFNECKFTQGKMNVLLAKCRTETDFEIKKVLNENIKETHRLLKDIKKTNPYKGLSGVNASINRRVKKIGLKKPHELRALYALLIHKFHEPNKPLSMVIQEYLGHSVNQSKYYDYIEMDIKENPFKKPPTNAELRKQLRESGYKGGVSKLNKAELLELVSA